MACQGEVLDGVEGDVAGLWAADCLHQRALASLARTDDCDDGEGLHKSITDRLKTMKSLSMNRLVHLRTFTVFISTRKMDYDRTKKILDRFPGDARTGQPPGVYSFRNYKGKYYGHRNRVTKFVKNIRLR